MNADVSSKFFEANIPNFRSVRQDESKSYKLVTLVSNLVNFFSIMFIYPKASLSLLTPFSKIPAFCKSEIDYSDSLSSFKLCL